MTGLSMYFAKSKINSFLVACEKKQSEQICHPQTRTINKVSPFFSSTERVRQVPLPFLPFSFVLSNFPHTFHPFFFMDRQEQDNRVMILVWIGGSLLATY